MRAKRILIGIAAFALSGFLIAYILIQLINSLSTDVSFQLANPISVEDTMEKTAYVVRNETVVEAPESGVVTYAVSEAQKVGASQIIATVYPSTHGVELQERIRRIDEKISVLESSTVDTSYLTSDVSKIDARLYDYLVKIRSSVHSDDIGQIFQYKEKFLINFNKRHLITSSGTDFSARIEELQNEKNDLTATLQNPIGSVYAVTPGYFSTLLDGYETLFTPDMVSGLTVDSYHRMIEQEPAEISPSSIGKIITDFDWYVLCEVDDAEAADLKTGASYDLHFPYTYGELVSGVLEKKVEQTDTDRVVLKFLIEEVPQAFDFSREQPVRIIKARYKGISIPRASLRIVDGVEGVYVISGNTVRFRKVTVLYQTETSYVCREYSSGDEDVKENKLDLKEYLARYEQVITEGKDLYDGKILD
ncbi:MAG: hypothetical protein II776_04190 [Clostridia bacterium]|nr:hypothetical protein [Clostridia bacterium]